MKQIPQKGEARLNWVRFKKYVPMLVEQNTPVTIDTVDACYQACLEHHCSLHPDRPKTPHNINDWGQLWAEIRQDFSTEMNKLLYSDTFTIFVSHGRYRELKTLTGEVENEQVIPTAPNAAFEYIKAVADMVMYYGYIGRKRAITIRGDQLVFASCGMEDRFFSADNEPIVTFDAGKSAKEAYRSLEKAFDNKLSETLVLGKGVVKED